MEINAAFTSMTDQEIILKILEGESHLFEILIRRNNTALYRIARSFGFNHQDAEDIMQDVHVNAFLNLAKFRNESSYKTWISRIMTNRCTYKLKYGYFKYEKPTEEIPEPKHTYMQGLQIMQPEAAASQREIAILLERSLQKLPLIYRTVFIMRETEGFTTDETARLLNITPVNVKVRLNRARALLQNEIERSYRHADLYSFNLVYCTAMVEKVFEEIRKVEKGMQA